jgi:hypothetical protein
MAEDAAQRNADDRPAQAPPPLAESPAIWYCAADGRQFGPVTAAELLSWATQGRVTALTPVWRDGMSDWAPMGEQPELAAETKRLGIDVAPRSRSIGDDPGIRLLLPVGRSGPAIVAGYLGLLSIIPAVGLLAIAFSLWAIADIRRNPKRHGMGRAVFGLVTGAVSTIFWAWMFAASPFFQR